MKKRVKLLTTIASLCLAVALMAFGVYAATTHTVAITSKVSFEVTDVYATITGNVTLGAAGQAGVTQGTDYSAKTYTGTNPMVPLTTEALAAWTVDDIAFTTANDQIVYTLTVVNNSADDSDAYVNLSAVLADVTGTTKAATYTTNNETGAVTGADYTAGTDVKLESGKQVVFTLTRTLTDKTVAIAEGTSSWSATLKVSRNAINA